jgi:hypothetical protein
MQQYLSIKLVALDLATKSAVLDSLALQLQRPYLYMGAIILVLAALVHPLQSEIDLDKDGKVLNQRFYTESKYFLKHPN